MKEDYERILEALVRLTEREDTEVDAPSFPLEELSPTAVRAIVTISGRQYTVDITGDE